MGKTKRRGAKLSAKKKLEKEADALWRLAVRKRAKGWCELCGKLGSDAHHMVGRIDRRTRWILANGVFLCKGCHLYFHNRESDTCWTWFRGTRRKDYDAVQSAINAPHKPISASDLEIIVEVLKQQ